MESALEFQRLRLRAMSTDEKLRVSHGLWLDAWNIAVAGERSRHPDWSEEKIAARVRELMRVATPGLVALFVAPLHKAAIDYMVTGGVASISYGHPRLTNDVDLVVRLRPDDAQRFAALWNDADFHCPPVESIASEMARADRGHFNVVGVDAQWRRARDYNELP